MSAPAPETQPFVVLDDAVDEARRTLPADVLAYVEGGAEDEHTLGGEPARVLGGGSCGPGC